MVPDNPCVPEPDRFILADGPKPISAVKMNNHLEIQLLSPFGLRASKESVYVNPRCQRPLSEWAAAIPFILGLKWIVRTAELDVVRPEIVHFDANALDLSWFHWQLEWREQDTFLRPAIECNRTSCSVVLFHAGGAPLNPKHVQALLEYIRQKVQGAWIGQRELSRLGFEAFWKEHYSFDGATLSPYELEASHISSIDAKFDRMMEGVDQHREQLEYTIEMAPFEPCWILRTLSKMYNLDEQVLRVFESLKKHWFGMTDADSLAAPSEGGGDSVAERATALACRDAARTAREIIGFLTKSQLQWCVNLVCGNLGRSWVQEALARIRRGDDVLEVMSYIH